MAGRRERCSQCGRLLVVPPEAHTIKCAVCHGITRIVQPNDPLSLAYNSASHAAKRLKGFINTITTGLINSSSQGYGGTTHYGYYPQPQPVRPPPLPLTPPPSAYGSKRAVLCGICYHGTSYRLKGSVTDVKCMRYFLINQLGFPSDSIRMLTDDKEERNPLKFPTKLNIQMNLRWLVEGCKSGDSLVFYFSGHGVQEKDLNMDEIDGYDEALCPVDYEYNGKIVDDEINATIVRPLPPGAKLHAIIDACHSGTVLDLPFLLKMNREGFYTWQDQRRLTTADHKGTRGGLAVCISACEDAGTSVDTSALSGNIVTGALTYSFIQAVQNEPGLTYGRLLSAMRSAISGAKAGLIRQDGPISALLNKLLGLDIRQKAQLSSSEKFDIHTKRFVL